ncbi:G-type lectin S-receptor-like serine/threonine-protein kinase At5g35370 [Olea europaea var. sylvestris]|uniref:G-type lectin S-receptor-like serine/threonine-protein kinase At5g35370 n=1 Tax=Olea europaea var. sylvestris TaxID=158386 RepID=UPI000C1D4EAD|nr:G-type lectin S-receptor-like serine/threonine-protein kinase At5g35370 [Olea europaea var. sylvestris]
MGSFLFFITFLSLLSALVYGISYTEFAYPNLTASNFKFVDASGSFLFSRNGTFKAAIFNPGAQQIRFYLCVIHVESNAIIWSANRDMPISNSGIMSLTANGIVLSEQDGSLKWSTPRLQSSVSVLQLAETGNLVLLDQYNETLWESFGNPTDTIVIGQKLKVGTLLSSGTSSDDLSTGSYALAVTTSDATLQWQALTYWKLSMDTAAYTNPNYAVDYMAVNQTGLYLYGSNGSVVVVQLNLPPSNFRIAKLDISGQFIVCSFTGADQNLNFVGPVDECRIPYICGRLGLCTNGISLNNPMCSCPSSFHGSSNNTTNCVPGNNSYSLAVSCKTANNSNHMNPSSLSYIRLGYNVDYFANDFTVPAKYGVNLSACEDLCSGDCACLGIFYDNSSGSCYVIENELGSVVLRTKSNGRLGFIKTIFLASHTNLGSDKDFSNDAQGFPTAAVVLLPLSGLILVIVIGIFLWRRSKLPKLVEEKSNHSTFPFSGDLEFSIPGLPLRFDYEELERATENFQTQIGTGGFGAVYKGMLPDKTFIAVKKINNLGVRGKKDFCTEIAIIGNIHHVNLVKLKGYCVQRRQWLLVYEYMNRWSLDKTLFGNGPVLEWQERVEIAVGVARGLAYLHSGCEKKIIHCDVKPENILLHDNFQAKISDFGLSKLLSPEQSSMFTTMRGTRGYLAPEWLTSSSITDKTDVYSFGMVLLEIVSGRKNCSFRAQSHSLDENHSAGGHSSSSSIQELIYFPLYALEMHEKGRYLELADPRLHGRVTNEEVEKFVLVALCCVHEEPGLRPNMVSVVGMLEGNLPSSQPRIESLNFLQFYGRRFTEASMVEETGVQDGVTLYQESNASHTSTKTVYGTRFSYVSSQQISGPR